VSAPSIYSRSDQIIFPHNYCHSRNTIETLYIWTGVAHTKKTKMIKRIVSALYIVVFPLLQVIGQCPPPGEYRLTSQAQVNDFLTEYSDCEELDGNLTIGQFIQPMSTDITDLSGFSNLKRITGDFRLREIDGDMAFGGLENINFIGGDLIIERNDLLKNLSVFGNLDSINGDFVVRYNSSIDTLFTANTISHVGQSIDISSNESLQSVNGFKNISTINSSLEIADCPMLASLEGFNSVTTINGRFLVFNTGVATFSDFSNLTEIVGQQASLEIIDNLNLSSLEGLNNLISIDGEFQITNNPNVTSLAELESIDFIGGYFEVSESSFVDLTGLENVMVGGSLIVFENNEFLTSISPLNISSTVNGSVRVVKNDQLVDISPLLEIDSIFGGLGINGNSSLSMCQSVCQLLTDGFIEAPVSIFNNAVGCNSSDEITDQNCTTSTDDQWQKVVNIAISPNPVHTEFILDFQTPPSNVLSSTLFSSTGQVVRSDFLNSLEEKQKVNVSLCDSGLYYLSVQTDQGTEVVKVIIAR